MRRRAGFTLLELLAAAALFSILGVLLFQMVRSAMDVWATGERNRELHERATAAFDLLGTDLRGAFTGLVGGDAPAQLLCTWREEDDNGDDDPERRLQLLRFTRLCQEERSLEWLARAGDVAGGEEAVSGLLPRDPAGLRATGGLAESLYTLARRPDTPLPALVRRLRAPAGGIGSLLDPELAGQQDKLLQDASVVIEDVLFFGVEFWGPGTQDWGADGGAFTAWDSTRGVLPPGDADFPFGVAGSLGDPSDDAWPRLVRLTLVLDRAQGAATAGRLIEPLAVDTRRLKLADTAFLRDEERPDHLLVGEEWVAVQAIEGQEVTVRRGARGTAAVVHADGSPVRAGRTFRQVIALPAGRELLLAEGMR